MKKKMWLAALAVTVSMILAACGSDQEKTQDGDEQPKESVETENTEDSAEAAQERYMKDLNAADYVTLGTYKGVEVAIDEPEVTEEHLESYIDYVLANSAVSVPVTDRSVETGDVVNIDYEGKFDGVAFEGGTAQGYDLTIGSGRFIEGFEDGCIGMEIGETRDVEATFPDPYTNNPDYAGKTAVFTVTVNSISVEEIPELTDEYVQSLGLEECSDVEEYKAYVYDVLVQEQQASYDSRKSDLAYEAVAAECEFKDAPAGMVERMNNTLVANLTSYANMYGADLGTYVSAVYGGTAEDYEETLLAQSSMMAQHYLMMQAIADAEGLTVSDEELEEELIKEAADYGYETADEYRELIDVEAFREYLMTQKVLEFISDNAVAVPVQ